MLPVGVVLGERKVQWKTEQHCSYPHCKTGGHLWNLITDQKEVECFCLVCKGERWLGEVNGYKRKGKNENSGVGGAHGLREG